MTVSLICICFSKLVYLKIHYILNINLFEVKTSEANKQIPCSAQSHLLNKFQSSLKSEYLIPSLHFLQFFTCNFISFWPDEFVQNISCSCIHILGSSIAVILMRWPIIHLHLKKKNNFNIFVVLSILIN